MNLMTQKKYTSDGGNEQRYFIKDAKFGWKIFYRTQESTSPMVSLSTSISNLTDRG